MGEQRTAREAPWTWEAATERARLARADAAKIPLNKKDRERLGRVFAWWDNGGWTQYCDSEPMAGSVARGSVEHAVLQSEPKGGDARCCTRRTLCGQPRCAVLSRAEARAFDDPDKPYGKKPCPVCLRLIGPFRERQQQRLEVSS